MKSTSDSVKIQEELARATMLRLKDRAGSNSSSPRSSDKQPITRPPLTVSINSPANRLAPQPLVSPSINQSSLHGTPVRNSNRSSITPALATPSRTGITPSNAASPVSRSISQPLRSPHNDVSHALTSSSSQQSFHSPSRSTDDVIELDDFDDEPDFKKQRGSAITRQLQSFSRKNQTFQRKSLAAFEAAAESDKSESVKNENFMKETIRLGNEANEEMKRGNDLFAQYLARNR